MMDGQNQGMVAVVRGLGDSQLAVTVLDSGKQYTLLPTSVLNPTNQQNERSPSTNTPYQHQNHQPQCHAAAQATDGQYTTVYKTAHCKVRPTSPPVQLTEFPPQRAAVAPGQGNFEVGGTGSGDTTFNFLRASGTYRGAGMVWPDRGCVCSPRPSREPDPFAESLRKYPAMSPERSAEIVERLINYTQGKNFAKVMRQPTLSPTRLSAEKNDMSPSRVSNRCRACELERNRFRVQGEHPTKDRPSKTERLDSDGESRKTFAKSYDVRFVKDTSRRVQEEMRNNPMSPCTSIKEAFEILNNYAAADQKPAALGGRSETGSGNNVASMAPLMVNSQTQASASTACKEVSTDSRHKMLLRNVAVSLSPQPSDVSRSEGAVFDPHPLLLQASVQTLVIPLPITVKKSVQTTQSSIDISSVNSTHTQNTKKCRSEIELSNKEVREEILGWLVDVLRSTYSKNLRDDVVKKLKEKMKNVSNDFGGEEAKVKLKVVSIDDNYLKDDLENICGELRNKMRIENRYHTQVYRAEVVPHREPEDLKRAIKDWLLELPLKTRDYCGKYINEEEMLTNFMKRLKRVLFSPDYDTKKLRNEIVKILKDIPIDYGSMNQIVYLNRLANNLIKKLLNANCHVIKNQSLNFEVENDTAKKKFLPNENEIKDFVRDEINDFLDKFNIKLSLKRLQDIETDIFATIMDFLNNMRSNNNEPFIEDVVRALKGIGAFEHQASYFANLILDHLKEFERSKRDQARRLHIMTVPTSTPNKTTENTKALPDGDIQNNLDSYIQQLTHQIDEWLAGLEVEIPWSQDESFRQIVVSDLADEIVERHKYVELKRNTTSSEKDELEYLKYLIFKWINKLVGEDHQDTIEHAPQLLKRIRSIPVPLLTNSNDTRYSKVTSPEFNQRTTFRRSGEIENMLPQASAFSPSIGYSVSKNVQAFPVPIAGPSRIENPTAATATNAAVPNMGIYLENFRIPIPAQNMNALQRLNEIYDEFVRMWVQTVHIPAFTSEELALAETMRVGLYNGIFQIVAKLRLQPQLLLNPFYYQDALDEELEELLSLLPQTPEFLKQKNQMKALMIEKTTELNEVIKRISSPVFKEQIDNEYKHCVPKFSTDLSKECPVRLYEELQILNITEDFLLLTKYKEEDPLKAYMYRKKLTDNVRELVNKIQRFQGKKLKDIDPDMYINQVMEALQQVPLPSEQAISEEADEILLGHAIDEWYKALPLAHNNNVYEQFKRKHLCDALTKKIQNIEKSLIVSGNTPEYELRHEISRFLEQIPLEQDENLNINYMVDALVDKVKDIVTPKHEVADLHNSTVNYSDFSNNIALNSTTVQVPEGYRLVGPLPSCCAAGMDRILAQPGPSSLQVQTPSASSAGQNVMQTQLPELESQTSMIGGGPPLITHQSFGQQSSGRLRQKLSPAEAGVKPRGFAQQYSEGQRENDPAVALEGTSIATAPGMVNATQNFSDDLRNTQRRMISDTQAGQSSSPRRTSISESGNNIQNISGSVGGQRRPSMGEFEYIVQSQSREESANNQIRHVSGSASGQRRPNMGGLENNTHSTSMGSCGSVSDQRKPILSLGKSTLSAQKQISTKDSEHRDGLRQCQCTRQTVECNNKSCKVSGFGTRTSSSQSKLRLCKKYNVEKVTLGKGKKCICAKTSDNSINFCKNAVTITNTTPCFSKGSKFCFCPILNKRKTPLSKSIEGQTSNQAISNADGKSTRDRLRLCKKKYTEHSVVGQPGQERHIKQHKLGTDFNYDRQMIEGTNDIQMTEGTNTSTREHSLAQPQEPIQKQGAKQYDKTQVDKKERSRIVRGHVPGPIRSDQLPQQAAGSQMPSTAPKKSSGGGITTKESTTPTFMGELETTERTRSPQPTLAQSGQPRNHRVSIITPPSQERLRQLTETSMTTTTSQRENSRAHSPENQILTGEDLDTYQGFVNGRPHSSSPQEQNISNREAIEQELSYVQPQVDTSIPSRRILEEPIQSSPIETLNPHLLNASLSNTITPQWVAFPQNCMQQPDAPTSVRQCVCPTYVPSPEQMSILSPGRTAFDLNQIYAPGKMFDQMTQPGQTSVPGMLFRSNGTFPGQRQFQEATQSRSLQESISQPRKASIIQQRQGSIIQPRQASIIQQRQGSISQSRYGTMSQSQQGRMTPSCYKDSLHSRYRPSGIPGADGYDFTQDRDFTMQTSEQERSILMQSIPSESQTVQPNVERRISMPNRSQILQDTSLEGRQYSAVQGTQEEQRISIVEGNLQSLQEQDEQSRSNRAASFSQNVQSRSRQGSILRTPQEHVEAIGQQREQQDSQRRMSQSVAEGAHRPVWLSAGQEGTQQSLQQEVTSHYVPQDSNVQQMDSSEPSMSQNDRRSNPALRKFSQNNTEQSARWQSIRPGTSPNFAPQNSQQSQDAVYQELRMSQNRSAVGEPVAIHFPSNSTNYLSFQQQAGPSPAIQRLVERGPVGVPSPSYAYPGRQGFQTDTTVEDFIPGQPVQVVQDPRAYIQPAAFSTPQRPIPSVLPQRPVKRGKRTSPTRDDELASSGLDQRRGNFDERRILYLSDSDSECGPRVRCRCYERLKRFRRRHDMYKDECDIPCPYAHYYYTTCF